MTLDEGITLRLAKAADAGGIARVHVDAWRDAYAALLPANHLAGMDYAKRAVMWSRILAASGAAQTTLVAEAEGEIVAFCGFGPYRPPAPSPGPATGPAEAEVYGLYIASDWREKGIGRRMLQRAFDALRRRGFGSVVIWCLEGNVAARGFYQRCGGRLLGETQIEDIAGMSLPTVGFSWDL